MVSGSALAGLRLVLARAPGLVPAAQDVQLETRPPPPGGMLSSRCGDQKAQL